jgi:ribosomal protein S27AE
LPSRPTKEEKYVLTMLYECGDCLAPGMAGSSTRNLCGACQTLRQLTYVHTKQARPGRTCSRCAARYFAAHSGDTVLCGSCEVEVKYRDTMTPHRCGHCKQEKVLYKYDLAFCWECIRDPKARKEIRASLVRFQARNRERYSDPAAVEERVLELWRSRHERIARMEERFAADKAFKAGQPAKTKRAHTDPSI